jgi:amino acid transporter
MMSTHALGGLPSRLDKEGFQPTDSGVSGTTHLNMSINASGHVQELDQSFSLLSLAGLGLVVGNVWPAIGGSILVAVYNGGPPGLLYEFITVSVMYWFVAASIAELASAIPSSAGVYHYASITPGSSWGRPLGFLAGWWNYLAWVLGCASMSSILANTLVQMYAQNHPDDFSAQPWHVFITYAITTWIACFAVCFAHSAMPALNKCGVFFILAGFIITIVVITVMPDKHASSAFVWKDWHTDIGYPDGFVFAIGMLNGAYSVGAVDATTHLAEEIPNPQRNVPLAILLQVSIGFMTGLCYLVALIYSIRDYNALFTSPYPIAEIYRQATGSAAGAVGLLSLIMICIVLTVTGLYITAGRTLWTLARDGAAPFPSILGHIHHRFHIPIWSTIVTALLVTLLGAIYVGNTTAFNNFVGSFILLSTTSFLACLLPHLITGRQNIRFGPFRMKGILGFLVNGIVCAYIIVWDIIYCFPASLPTNATSMNYASVIWGGFTLVVGLWWFVKARREYIGPPNMTS